MWSVVGQVPRPILVVPLLNFLLFPSLRPRRVTGVRERNLRPRRVKNVPQLRSLWGQQVLGQSCGWTGNCALTCSYTGCQRTWCSGSRQEGVTLGAVSCFAGFGALSLCGSCQIHPKSMAAPSDAACTAIVTTLVFLWCTLSQPHCRQHNLHESRENTFIACVLLRVPVVRL